MRRPRVLSLGGGLDSFAMLVEAIRRNEIRLVALDAQATGHPDAAKLLAEGCELPDIVVFIDVGHPEDPGEWPGTYRHVEEVVRPLCVKHGIEFVRIDHTNYPVRGGTKGEARSLFAWWKARRSMPMAGPGRQCTTIAKVERFEKWLTDRFPDQDVEVWIGFEKGEEDRAAKDPNSGVRSKPKPGAARRHNRFPLIEWGLCRCRCVELVRVAGFPVPRKSACLACLAGDTEVVTRDGVRSIRALSGGEHELLVPQMGKFGGLAHRGKFQLVEVRSFGDQPLWEIRLRRMKSVRTIRVTAEHRWFITAGPQWDGPRTYERTTEQLCAGDRLRTLRATPPAKEQLMPVAVAQGFVFGDGSRGNTDERPAYVTFYGKKDLALLPYFAGMPVRKVAVRSELGGRRIADKPARHIYGLPRFWKELPPLRESRAFLLSWLAGYFAADGSVTVGGQAVLESANIYALRFARDAAAICGVGYSKIQSRLRLGKGKKPMPLYRFSFRVVDLPDWFFLIKHHAERTAKVRRSSHDQPWVVEEVRPLGISEEVFCAVVPGAQAFGLSEDLMTGNCPFASRGDWQRFAAELPEQFAQVVQMEADRPLTKNGIKLSIMGFSSRTKRGPSLPQFVAKPYTRKVEPCDVCGAPDRATKATGCDYLEEGRVS